MKKNAYMATDTGGGLSISQDNDKYYDIVIDRGKGIDTLLWFATEVDTDDPSDNSGWEPSPPTAIDFDGEGYSIDRYGQRDYAYQLVAKFVDGLITIDVDACGAAARIAIGIPSDY